MNQDVPQVICEYDANDQSEIQIIGMGSEGSGCLYWLVSQSPHEKDGKDLMNFGIYQYQFPKTMPKHIKYK